MDLFELILRGSIVVKLVLMFLLSLSILSWGVILYKQLHLQRAAQESAAFMQAFESGLPLPRLAEQARALPASPLAAVFLHAMSLADVPPERWHSSVARAMVRETQKLHAHLILLATIGSSAPFIGLFGTVWGIVHAFQKIGASGSASLAVVAPGIAEALVTTAAGLAAAIPAVAAYNHQSNYASQITAEIEPVAADLPRLIASRPA